MIVAWQRQTYEVRQRGVKRKDEIPAEIGQTKKPRAEKSYQPLMIATVGAHCDGCGKENHTRTTPCNQSDHPDWNATGKWVGSDTYKQILKNLVDQNKGDEHPVLRWNFHADGDKRVECMRKRVFAASTCSFVRSSAEAASLTCAFKLQKRWKLQILFAVQLYHVASFDLRINLIYLI